ncbi:MAG: hypothetical protein ABIG96_03700 [Candidatus Micrarchaeota archaeon]
MPTREFGKVRTFEWKKSSKFIMGDLYSVGIMRKSKGGLIITVSDHRNDEGIRFDGGRIYRSSGRALPHVYSPFRAEEIPGLYPKIERAKQIIKQAVESAPLKALPKMRKKALLSAIHQAIESNHDHIVASKLHEWQQAGHKVQIIPSKNYLS